MARISWFSKEHFETAAKAAISPVNTVLDIGCGIRPQRFFTAKTHICVDPNPEYLRALRTALYKPAFMDPKLEKLLRIYCSVYNNPPDSQFVLLHGYWNDIEKMLLAKSVDSLIATDVIEHIPKEIGKELLILSEKIAREQIVIFTPYGFVEQEHDDGIDAWGLKGGEFQRHLSGWTEEDFDDSWDIYACADFHTIPNRHTGEDEIFGAMYAIKNIPQKQSFVSLEGLLDEDTLTKPPMFSVIMPLYNQAQYVGEALDTLLAQTFPDWECVIVDDGSTDNSGAAALSYVEKDKRFRYYKKENGGCASALNEGLKHVTGEWICWLSSDDFFEPDKLENHIKAIGENPDCKFFYSLWYAYLEDSQQKVPQGLKYAAPNADYQVLEFFRINYVHGNSFAMHKSVAADIGNFNVELRQGQDFDMWLRVSAKYRTKFMPVRTCTTRIHAAQTTNMFPEGGTFDSTRSLFEFTGPRSFAEIFPFTNVSAPETFERLFRDVLVANIDPDFFVNKLGPNTILIDKALAYASETFSSEQRSAMQERLTPYLKTLLSNVQYSPALTAILNDVDLTKPYVPRSNNLLALVKSTVAEIAKTGYQKKCKVYEKFIYNYTGGTDPGLLYYAPQAVTNATELSPESILSWKINALSQKKNLVAHTLQISCSSCGKQYQFYTEYEFSTLPQSEEIRCPHCKTDFRFSETLIAGYAEYWQKKNAEKKNIQSSYQYTFAFIVPVADYLGGGTQVVFRYLKWLEENNVSCAVYTKTAPPDWMTFTTEFKRYETLTDIDFSNAQFMVSFSVFEVLELLPLVSPEKIVHLCQGYQGYHYGTTYERMREDKYAFEALHAIPVHLLVVSPHLEMLFKTKFNRQSLLVPNYIDHSVFYPRPEVKKLPNSILFVGTPDHLLKNFIFLVQAIKHCKTIEPEREIAIHLVTGHLEQNDELTGSNLTAEAGVTIQCYHHIHPQEMATLMNAVSVVCCTSWYEGFGLPVLEAMACGTPVVSTNTMGTEVFCHDGKNSRVIHCQDGTGFANALLHALRADDEVKNMLPAAMETAATYNYNKSAEAFCKSMHVLTGITLTLPYSAKEVTPKTAESFIPVDINLITTEQLPVTGEQIDFWAESSSHTLRLNVVSHEFEPPEIYALSKNRKNLLHVLYLKNSAGISDLLNRCLRAARNEYVLIAFGGVTPQPGTIELLYQSMENLPREFGMLFASGAETIQPAAMLAEVNFHQIAKSCSYLCLLRPEVVKEAGGFDDRFSSPEALLDDYMLRVQFAGFKILRADNLLCTEAKSQQYQFTEADQTAFEKKWKGTAKDIFSGATTAASRHHLLPLDTDPMKELLFRGQVMIQDSDVDAAYHYYQQVLDMLQAEPNRLSAEEIAKIGTLTEKLRSLTGK